MWMGCGMQGHGKRGCNPVCGNRTIPPPTMAATRPAAAAAAAAVETPGGCRIGKGSLQARDHTSSSASSAAGWCGGARKAAIRRSTVTVSSLINTPSYPDAAAAATAVDAELPSIKAKSPLPTRHGSRIISRSTSMNTHLSSAGVAYSESPSNQNVLLLKYSSGNGTMFGLFGSQSGQTEAGQDPASGETSPNGYTPTKQAISSRATSPGVKANSPDRTKALTSPNSRSEAVKGKPQLVGKHGATGAVSGPVVVHKPEHGTGPVIREDDSGYHSRENSLEKNWCSKNRKCVLGETRWTSEGSEGSRESSGEDLGVNPAGRKAPAGINNNKTKSGSSSSEDGNDNMKAHRSSDDLLQAIRARRAKSPAVRPKPEVETSKSKVQRTGTGIPKPTDGSKVGRNEQNDTKEDGYGTRRNNDRKAHSRDSSIEDRRRKPKPRISIAQPQDVVKELQRQRAWAHSRQGSREDLLSEDIHVMGSDRPAWGSELVRISSDNLDDLPWSQGRVSSLEDLLEDCGAKTRLFGSGDNHLSVLKCLTGGSTSPIEKEVKVSGKDSKSKQGGTSIGSPPNAKTLLNKLNGWIHDHHNNNRVENKRETKSTRHQNNANFTSIESPSHQTQEKQNSSDAHRSRAQSPHSTVGPHLLQSQKPQKVQEDKPKRIVPKRHAPPVPRTTNRTTTDNVPDDFVDVCDEALIYEQRARDREEKARESHGQKSHRRTAREVKRSRSLKDLFRGRSKSRGRDQEDSDSSPTVASFADKWNDLLRNGLPGGYLLDQHRMPNGGSTHPEGHGLVSIRMKPDSQGRFGFNVKSLMAAKGGADQGMPIIVSRVAPNTPADLCIPRLNEGDQVLFINGRDVSQHTHEQVVMFIRASRETHSGELVLVVRPNVYIGEDSTEEPDFQYIPDTHHITTTLPQGSDPLAGSLLLLGESLDSGAALAQFEQLYRKKPGLTMNAARMSDNIPKNRYRDISPYDQTRVLIKDGTGDYINANYVNMEIPGSGIVNRYIAAQGPLPNTCADFWQMVWEQQSRLVIMLTTKVERGRVKCHQYWPDLYETMDFGPVQVTCLKEEQTQSFAFREFTLINSGQSNEERHIQQMQYLAWPDHGVPDDSRDFLDFVVRVRQNRVGMVEPTVVHCSAGIGRTGVLITMETAMCLIEANQPVYPLDIVRQMRDQRAMLIQTASQYKFVCEAIRRVYHEKMVKPLEDYQR